ncbi:MAG: transcriptional repressor [Clostridiales bacterium]|nr:transcriptional repressor [Clostridiales bacterium]
MIIIIVIVIEMKEMTEKTKKFSRKREAIRKVLTETDTHPSAEWIYNRLKPEFPDLSLATVYRNLGEMKKSGEIQSVAFWDGKERFDGVAKKHSHFVCEECGKIEDFDFIHQDMSIDDKARANFDGTIDFHTLVFYGLCEECSENVGKKC